MKSVITAAALALAALSAAPAAAVVTAVYSTGPSTPGNQTFGGSLGLNFDASSAFSVSGLGAFDSGKDGITTNIFVTILDRNTGLAVAPTINFNGTANPGGDAYVFQAISTIYLAAGNYQLLAYGYNSTDANYNTYGGNPGLIAFNSLGGKLTALDASYSFTPGVLATIGDVGTTRYGAGTFLSAIPEPATWGLMIAGFAMVGVAARRRAALTA